MTADDHDEDADRQQREGHHSGGDKHEREVREVARLLHRQHPLIPDFRIESV